MGNSNSKVFKKKNFANMKTSWTVLLYWLALIYFSISFCTNENNNTNSFDFSKPLIKVYSSLEDLSSNFLKEVLKTNSPPKYIQLGSEYPQHLESTEGQGTYQLFPYYQKIEPMVKLNNHDPRYII